LDEKTKEGDLIMLKFYALAVLPLIDPTRALSGSVFGFHLFNG